MIKEKIETQLKEQSTDKKIRSSLQWPEELIDNPYRNSMWQVKLQLPQTTSSTQQEQQKRPNQSPIDIIKRVIRIKAQNHLSRVQQFIKTLSPSRKAQQNILNNIKSQAVFKSSLIAPQVGIQSATPKSSSVNPTIKLPCLSKKENFHASTLQAKLPEPWHVQLRQINQTIMP